MKKKNQNNYQKREALRLVEVSAFIQMATGMEGGDYHSILWNHACFHLTHRCGKTQERAFAIMKNPQFWASWVRQWGALDEWLLDQCKYDMDRDQYSFHTQAMGQWILTNKTDWMSLYMDFHRTYWPELYEYHF